MPKFHVSVEFQSYHHLEVAIDAKDAADAEETVRERIESGELCDETSGNTLVDDHYADDDEPLSVDVIRGIRKTPRPSAALLAKRQADSAPALAELATTMLSMLCDLDGGYPWRELGDTLANVQERASALGINIED